MTDVTKKAEAGRIKELMSALEQIGNYIKDRSEAVLIFNCHGNPESMVT